MQSRIDSPAQTLPDVLSALQKLSAAAHRGGVPKTTLLLTEVRASQINGCSVCLDMHTRELRNEGESDERIFMVGAWREAPYFTDAERAALALTESMTRLADQSDPVPDAVWEEAARHYDEQQLAALVVAIAGINTWNRINAATRQITGEWVTQFIPAPQAA
ncbi:MAG TPA: carboxymuconolactone decarboxylase family protein [Solirubrobacteraceae bacterium]|nr:carboxymuconolactone decarboxylase family protein [Solirubrobacteraceae bacterium]